VTGVALFLGGHSNAFAFLVSDGFNTCDSTELINNPHPPPLSLCPASLSLFFHESGPYSWLERIFFPNGLPDSTQDPAFWYGTANGVIEVSPLPTRLGGPVSFSLYGNNGGGNPYAGPGAYGNLDVSGTHGDGFRVSDTAGLFAPGSVAPSFRSIDASGGFKLNLDGSSLLNLAKDENLILGLNGEDQYDNTNYGTSALTPGVANAGNEKSNSFLLKGSATYSTPSYYLRGLASAGWGRVDIVNNVNVVGAKGDTDAQGYGLQATAGKLIPLFGAAASNPGIVTKAPPKTGYSY
jgi:hypothetical protein